MRVAVCVATYRRPVGLERVLGHLDALTFEKSPPPELGVVVVDNDPEGSAAELCERLRPRLRWPLRYVHEPRRGISYARNRAVASVVDEADFVVFVDDDEAPEPYWLDELLHAQRRWQADVVSGPVEPRFEGEVPRWIVEGGFFDSERFADGARLEESGTGNVLVRAEVFRSLTPHFDERLALTGGEDVEFFRRVVRAGYSIVWADAALVYEWIPSSRARAGWILRRSYRMGTSFGAHGGEADAGAPARAVRALKAAARAAQAAVALPLSALVGRSALVRSLCSLSFRVGQLAGMAGLTYQEYRTTHGQ